MVLVGKFDFLGYEMKKGQKRDYIRIGLNQDMDSIQLITYDLTMIEVMAKLNKYDQVKATVNFSFGKYENKEVVKIEKLDKK